MIKDGSVFLKTNSKKRSYLNMYHPYCEVSFIDSELVLDNKTNLKFRKDTFFPMDDNEKLKELCNEECSNIVFTSNNDNFQIFKYEYYKGWFYIECDYLSDGLLMHFLPKCVNSMDSIIIENDRTLLNKILFSDDLTSEQFIFDKNEYESSSTDKKYLETYSFSKDKVDEYSELIKDLYENYNQLSSDKKIISFDDILYSYDLLFDENGNKRNLDFNQLLKEDKDYDINIFYNTVFNLIYLNAYLKEVSSSVISEYIIPLQNSDYDNTIEINTVYRYDSTNNFDKNVIGVLDNTNKNSWNATTLMTYLESNNKNKINQNNRLENDIYNINEEKNIFSDGYNVSRAEYQMLTNKYINDNLYSEDFKISEKDFNDFSQYIYETWHEENEVQE